ncbi:MmgE/PrpD family protein [Ruegeria sp. HKCCD6228]|uniref:MmgE/PrpD family protein n=1 Tax=unclassified Ruegeria TaxID=2625375 RepID=UPI001488B121|nr:MULTISPECIES: MmgE/PrpD family protein [unclassified Ruegeria]NOC82210.1 MmgE/PrpD family protein [Ruegeria sp. HKCCD6428]NOD96310.1 MmgE/PrpD family protein [Ruegeria sp. HKCCD6228]
MTDFTAALATFAAGPVSTTAQARIVTSLSVLDWMAVGRAGASEPVSCIVRDMVLAEGGNAQAHLFGGGAAPLRGAALVNGTISHALDYDDTHFAHIGHPSVAILPATLAVAEWDDRILVDLLEAALVGMETSIRVGLWLGRGHYQAGFHQTATSGAFGAAVAVGRLLGFDKVQMRSVLGLTATRAAGLKAQFGTMGKPYNAGLAASAGVEAAVLVQRGFQPNADALEGTYGFGATHQGAADQGALDGLGDEWLFETVSHKFHACCHGLHAALEAARALDIAEPEVAEIKIKTHPRWMSVCNQLSPTTGLGAKFSYRTVIAMQALGYDTALPGSYTDKVCADPRITSLQDRITVEAEENLSETQAHLALLRRDGIRREATHDLLTPMSLSDREDRVRAKASKLIGTDEADAIWSMLRTGGRARDLAERMAG